MMDVFEGIGSLHPRLTFFRAFVYMYTKNQKRTFPRRHGLNEVCVIQLILLYRKIHQGLRSGFQFPAELVCQCDAIGQ